uniref:CC domain-containing protein n=1 Tax=Ascaris lumbricoides TaxID=6252 RepID=A0A0M3HTW5_ASCLU
MMIKWFILLSLFTFSTCFVFRPLNCMGSSCGMPSVPLCHFGTSCNDPVLCGHTACAPSTWNHFNNPCIGSNCDSPIPVVIGDPPQNPCSGVSCNLLPLIGGSTDGVPCSGTICGPDSGTVPLAIGGNPGLFPLPLSSFCSGSGCGLSSHSAISNFPSSPFCIGSACSPSMPLPFPLGSNACGSSSRCNFSLPSIIIIEGPVPPQNPCSAGSNGCSSGFSGNSPLMAILRGVPLKRN